MVAASDTVTYVAVVALGHFRTSLRRVLPATLRQARTVVTCPQRVAWCVAMSIIEPTLLARWVAECRTLWQMPLQNSGQLAAFASRRGVNCNEDEVRRLWGLGLLRGDVVLSRREIEAVGLTYATRDPLDNYVYCDGGAGRDALRLELALTSEPDGRWAVEPLFHPFRYLLVAVLVRSCTMQIRVIPSSVETENEDVGRVPFSAPTVEQVRMLDELVSLAIAVEPGTFRRLFGSVTSYGWDTHDLQVKRIEAHRQRLMPLFRDTNLAAVSDAHRKLCEEAMKLDPNKSVHTLIRLGSASLRLEVQGTLGGAVLVDTMAEMVRRMAEESLGRELPEEDEVGYGMLYAEVKRELYGGSRLRDGGPETRDFLRRHQLDYGVRVRWYVEGDTESGALGVIKSIPGVEVVNLRGQVVESKMLAFRETLRADTAKGIFSVISIDTDRPDSIRAITQAAEADEFCGRIFLSNPDFETANFSIPDMSAALAILAGERGGDEDLRRRVLDCGEGAQSRSELFDMVAGLAGYPGKIGKGSEWGQALMAVAFERPLVADGSKRQILRAVDDVLRLLRCEYASTRTENRVDAKTGALVKRDGGSKGTTTSDQPQGS